MGVVGRLEKKRADKNEENNVHRINDLSGSQNFVKPKTRSVDEDKKGSGRLDKEVACTVRTDGKE